MATGEDLKRVLVVGTGPFAQGFAKLAVRSGAVPNRYWMSMGSRRLQPGAAALVLPGLEEVPIVPLTKGLEGADIVVLALQAGQLPDFVAAYGTLLGGKVVLDVTNPWRADLDKLNIPTPSRHSMDTEASPDGDCPSPHLKTMEMGKMGADFQNPQSVAGWLQQALRPLGASVVKGFNNLSAYMLMHGDPLTEHIKTVLASEDHPAAMQVADLATAMGVETRFVRGLKYARVMEGWQRSLLNEWRWPLWTMLIMFGCIYTYSAVRYNHFGGVAWYHTIMFVMNKAVAWTSLWGLLITYLPGTLISCTQLVTRKPQLRLWGWFKAWMDGRKQLGILTMVATFMHLVMSAFLWLPSYYAKLFETDTQVMPKLAGRPTDKYGFMKPGGVNQTVSVTLSTAGTVLGTSQTSPDAIVLQTVNAITTHSQLNVYGELVIMTGLAAALLMFITGFTSMPSITPKLNWREWRVMQSWFGWLCLALSTVHTMVLAPVPAWDYDKGTWPAGIPTITLISTAPTMLLLAVKIVLECPPVPAFLRNVRAGKYKRGDALAVFC